MAGRLGLAASQATHGLHIRDYALGQHDTSIRTTWHDGAKIEVIAGHQNIVCQVIDVQQLMFDASEDF